MCSVRVPASSPSWVMGDSPAKISTGTRPLDALCTAPPRFWVPQSTCTMTACGSPLTCAYPWAALSATLSCGQRTSSGNAASDPADAARAYASRMPVWSLPRFANAYLAPASRIASSRAVLAV